MSTAEFMRKGEDCFINEPYRYNGCHSIFHRTKPVTYLVLVPWIKPAANNRESGQTGFDGEDNFSQKCKSPSLLLQILVIFVHKGCLNKLVYLSIFKNIFFLIFGGFLLYCTHYQLIVFVLPSLWQQNFGYKLKLPSD